MAYFADLTPYAYFPPSPYIEQHDALNVGWLSKDEAFETGPVPASVLEQLRERCARPVNLCRGFHVCEFCAGRVLGNGEIRVSGNGVTYAAPTLIGHYVEAHGYRPPQAFLDAIMDGAPGFEPGTFGARTRRSAS